jgi:hypothetical protein
VRLRPVESAPSISPTDEAAAPPALVGIAVQETPNGRARTAVFMTTDGEVEFAQTGLSVGGGRFRISNVTADGAVLVNLKTGAIARLSLQ